MTTQAQEPVSLEVDSFFHTWKWGKWFFFFLLFFSFFLKNLWTTMWGGGGVPIKGLEVGVHLGFCGGRGLRPGPTPPRTFIPAEVGAENQNSKNPS